MHRNPNDIWQLRLESQRSVDVFRDRKDDKVHEAAFVTGMLRTYPICKQLHCKELNFATATSVLLTPSNAKARLLPLHSMFHSKTNLSTLSKA